MKRMVLGRPIRSFSPEYRGTYREEPFHFDDTPEDHEANRAFHLYASLTDEGGPIADMDKAVMILRTYRRLASKRDFELVEVVSVAERSAVGGPFLGYDISCGFYDSLVAAGLEMTSSEASAPRHPLAHGRATVPPALAHVAFPPQPRAQAPPLRPFATRPTPAQRRANPRSRPPEVPLPTPPRDANRRPAEPPAARPRTLPGPFLAPRHPPPPRDPPIAKLSHFCSTGPRWYL